MMTRRGNTLVASLATVAIILVLVVAMFKGSNLFGKSTSTRADGKGTTVMGAARYAAKDDVCRSNLGQVRSALQILSTNEDDKFPDDLRATKLPTEFYSCPVGHEPYGYDPASGRVWCVHPGHERY